MTGAYPLDVDGDGLVDLAVLRVGEIVLLRGLGDCRFERANEAWGFDGGRGWTTAFSATWERGATLPTLAFGDVPSASTRPDAPAFECDDSLPRCGRIPRVRATPPRSRWRPATAPCRCCSATGTARAGATCG